MSTSNPPRTVVLGVGNPLMGDDGFGLAVLERLRAEWEVPEGVELVDGGTWGMNLLPTIEDADALLILDAINVGFPAGCDVVLERIELPRYVATKLSPHEVDLRDVLALAELRGHFPARAVAIGVQPSTIELREGLSALALARIESTLTRVVSRLRRWGWRFTRRDVTCTS